jgi:stage II sporulation protein M
MEVIWEAFKGKNKYITFALTLFILGALSGYFVFWHNPQFVLSNLEKLLGNILKIGRVMTKSSRIYVTGLIFQNNIKALLLIMFGGAAFGTVPFFYILLNGFVVGLVMAMNFYHGKTLAFFLAAIAPHGILELPAILVGGAFGLKTGVDLIFPRSQNRLALLKENLQKSVLALALLVPILFVAAFIEAVITPHIAKFFI